MAHDEGETQFYDFESKYQDTGTTQLSCPAELPEEEIERLRALAIRAFEAVDGSGLGRCDFFFTPDGRWVVNEINTMPGFTPISMYPAMWERTGLSYDDLISELLDLALERGSACTDAARGRPGPRRSQPTGVASCTLTQPPLGSICATAEDRPTITVSELAWSLPNSTSTAGSRP